MIRCLVIEVLYRFSCFVFKNLLYFEAETESDRHRCESTVNSDITINTQKALRAFGHKTVNSSIKFNITNLVGKGDQ